MSCGRDKLSFAERLREECANTRWSYNVVAEKKDDIIAAMVERRIVDAAKTYDLDMAFVNGMIYSAELARVPTMAHYRNIELAICRLLKLCRYTDVFIVV